VAARKAKGKTKSDKPQPAEAQVDPADGVVLLVSENNGNFNVAVQTLGKTKVTEVQTILAVALKQHRKDIGLDEG